MKTKEENQKCPLCDQKMKQIGPFADVFISEKSVKKWDGVLKFQCTKCGFIIKRER